MEGSQQVSETNSSSEPIHSKVTHVFGHAQKQWYTSAVQNSEHPNLNQEVRSGNGTSTQPMLHCQQESERSISAIPKSTKEPSEYTCISDTTLTSKPDKGCEEKKKSRGREKSNSIAQESQKDRGITRFLDGISYQKNLLILTLCHAFKLVQNDDSFKFNITSEDPEGGKFDDIVVRFKNDYEDSSVFIQAKHKENLESKITLADLKSTDKTAPFSISKYFNDFLHQNWDKTNEARVLILCTNAGIAQDAKDFMKEYSFNGSIVDSFLNSLSDNVYTIDELRVDKKSKTTLIDHLKENTDLYSLAKQIADRIFKQNNIDWRHPLFNKYKNVINQIASKPSKRSKCYNINEDFFNCLQANEFKNIFEKEYRKLHNYQLQDIWEDIRGKGIRLSQAKTTENQQNVQLEENNPFESCGLPRKVDDSQIQKFFQSFIIVCNTKYEKNEPIKNMLKKLLPPDIHGPAHDLMYDSLSNWLMERRKTKSGCFLTKNDINQFFEHIVSSMHYFQINDALKIQRMELQCKNDILIKTKLYEKLNLWLSEPNSDESAGISKINIKRCSYPPWLVIQVIQILRDNCAENSQPNFAFLEATSYEKNKETIRNVFCAMDFPLILVIDCKETNSNADEFSKWHQQNKSYKKMIITIGQFCTLEDAEAPFLIQHLTDESRNAIKTKNTNFFGTTVAYEDIFCDRDTLNFVIDIQNFRDDSVVKRNIIDEKFGKIQQMYISRKWKRWDNNHDAIKKKSLKEFWNYRNQFNEMGQKSCKVESIALPDMLRDFFMSDKEYIRKSRLYTRKHFLEEENHASCFEFLDEKDSSNDGSFQENSSDEDSAYANSSGDNSSDRDERVCYLDASDEDAHEGDSYFNDKVHILLNEAGAGKTYYITWLAKHLQSRKKCEDCWVVKLSLINHCMEFKNKQDNFQKMNELDAIKLLFQLTYMVFYMVDSTRTMHDKRAKAKEISDKLQDSEGKIVLDRIKLSQLCSEEMVLLKIFVHKFNSNKLVVLMDGFDEITPDYKDVVLKLLSILKSLDGVCKIYLTSRPYAFKNELDATLGDCRYYRLEHFCEKEIFIYTRQFLSIHFEGYQSFDEKMQNDISLLHVHLLKFLSNIIKIPQFLSMGLKLLLPVFEKNWNSEFISSQIFYDCEDNLSPLSLVETLIKKKLIISLEKYGECVSTPEMMIIIREKYQKIKKKHSILALYAVLDLSEVEELLSLKQKEKATCYMEDLKNGNEKSGIINEIVNNVPIFCHRLFSEYFTALWFFNNVNQATVQNFLKYHVLANDGKTAIRWFLNRMVCKKHVLHTAIVDNSPKKVKGLLIEFPHLIEETDVWRRTPLQLAFFCDSVVAVDLLLDLSDYGQTKYSKDQYFEWTAIDYAYNWLKFWCSGYHVTEKLVVRALLFECRLRNGVVLNMERVNFLKRLYTKLTLDLASANQLEIDLPVETKNFLEFDQTRRNSRETTLHRQKSVTLLELCAILDSPMLQILVENSNEAKNIQSRVFRLIELAFEYRSVNSLYFLTVNHKFRLLEQISFEHALLELIMFMQYNEREFRYGFHKYCERFYIPCLEENQLPPVFEVQRREKIFPLSNDLWRYFPTEWEFVSTLDIDTGTAFLISAALQTNTLSILEYLIAKIKIVINNRFIKSIVKSFEINWDCQSSFQFLVHMSEDLRNVDEHGRTLLHFAIEQGQFNLVKYLTEFNGFQTTDSTRAEKNWDVFFYCVSDKESKDSNSKYEIFKYLMDFFRKTPLDCFYQLDSDGKNVFYYAALCNQNICKDIIARHFSTPLKNFNEEQITQLTNLLQLSGLNSEEIFGYFEETHLSSLKACKIICEALGKIEILQNKDSRNRNLLHIAIRNGWFVLAKCLIEHFDFNVCLVNEKEYNWNAFFYCVSTGCYKCSEERLLFFSYVMEKFPLFNCFDQLDSHEKSVFYYASKYHRNISNQLIYTQFSTPLKELNGEQITGLISLLRSSGFNSEEIILYFGISYQEATAIRIMSHAAQLIQDNPKFDFTITSLDHYGGRMSEDIVFRLENGYHVSDIFILAKYNKDEVKKFRLVDMLFTEKKSLFSISTFFNKFVQQNLINTKGSKLLVLCTNIGLADDDENCFIKYSFDNRMENSFLMSMSNNVYKIDQKMVEEKTGSSLLDHLRENIDLYKTKKNRNQQDNFLSEVKDSVIQTFLDSFILICNSKPDDAITNTLEKSDHKLSLSGVPGPTYEFAYDTISSWIIRWIQNKNGAFFTKKDTNGVLSYFKLPLKYLKLKALSKLYCKKQNLGLQCNKSILMEKKLFQILNLWSLTPNSNDSGIGKVTVKRSNNPPWLVLNILQCIEDMHGTKLSYVFLKQKSYEQEKEIVKSVFCGMNFPFILVISCKDTKISSEEFLKWHSQHPRYVIIITSEPTFSSENAEEQLLIKHLTNESRNNIINQKTSTNFFGTTISCNNLYHEQDCLNFVSNVQRFPKEAIIKRNVIKEKYDRIKQVYIERRLKRYSRRIVSDTTSKWNWYGKRPDVDEKGMFFEYLAQDEMSLEKFGSLLQRLEQQNRPSSVRSSDLNDQCYYEGKVYINTDINSCESRDVSHDKGTMKVHIICNEAGSGKSFYLTWLAVQCQVEQNWVIRFNLCEHFIDFQQIQTEFEDFDELDAIKQLMQLIYFVFYGKNTFSPKVDETCIMAEKISKALKFSDKNISLDDNQLKSLTSEQVVLLRLFENKFNNRKLIVLIDGINDVAPRNSKLLLRLLSTLKDVGGITELYLSSRPYNFEQEFKDAFGNYLFYSLEQLSNADKSLYTDRLLLTHFHKYPSCDTLIKNNIINMIVQSLNLFLGNITEIPLFLTMGLELLLPIIRKNFNFETKMVSLQLFDDCGKHFSHLSMMESFVRMKLRIVGIKNLSLLASITDVKQIVLENFEEIKKTHSVLALYLLTNKSEVEELLSREEHDEAIRFMEDLKNGSEKSGIVEGIVDDVPIFIHRLFAEYFAALWFFCNVNRENVKTYLKNSVYARKEKEGIRFFLDRMICKENHLHMAIIEDSKSAVENLLNQRPVLFIEKDSWGRTPLQLALLYGPKFTHELLFDRIDEMDINAKDIYLGWTTLGYAHKGAKLNGENLLSKLYVELLQKGIPIKFDEIFSYLDSEDHIGMIEDVLFLEFQLNYDYVASTVEKNIRTLFKELFTKMVDSLTCQKKLDLKLQIPVSAFIVYCKANFSLKRHNVEEKHLSSNTLPLLELCIITDSSLFQILTEQFSEYEYEQSKLHLIELAIENRSLNVLEELIIHRGVRLHQVADIKHKLLVLVLYMHHDESKFKTFFNDYCRLYKIDCLDEDKIQTNSDSVLSKKPFDNQLLDYLSTNFAIDSALNMDCGTKYLIASALQADKTSILEYLIEKTETTVNNCFIRKIVQIDQIYDRWCCKSSFHFLIDKCNSIKELRSVDKNGRNLLHFAVENSQFNLVKCLIQHYEFETTDRNPNEKRWDAFFYCVKELPYKSNTQHSRCMKFRYKIFKYLMDLRKDTPLDFSKHLDSEGNSVCYYASKYIPEIAYDICQRKS